jgi:large subunit ribosomal protein L23
MKPGQDVIHSVCLTEKATLMTEQEKPKYVFKVDPRANKIEIKQAVQDIFNVKVLSVNTANYTGKMKRERTMHYGRQPNWKKAIVTLKEGDSIDLI